MTHARSQNRHLAFGDLQEVMVEVGRLRRGCRNLGRWTLAQVCTHLALSFDGSIDGFGTNRHAVMRTLFGRIALRKVFASGSIDSGFTVTEDLNPPEDIDLDQAVARLAAAIERFTFHDGPLQLHPFFGRLTRNEWGRLHRIHCAHHLRLLESTEEFD